MAESRSVKRRVVQKERTCEPNFGGGEFGEFEVSHLSNPEDVAMMNTNVRKTTMNVIARKIDRSPEVSNQGNGHWRLLGTCYSQLCSRNYERTTKVRKRRTYLEVRENFGRAFGELGC